MGAHTHPDRTVPRMASTALLDRALQVLAARAHTAATAYRWQCDLPECDGLPHDGSPVGHARTKQRAPDGRWKVWLLLCGRGFGKTRTGSEVFLDRVLANPVDAQGRPTWHLIGSSTHKETVNLMVKGVSSLTFAMDRRGIKYRWNTNEGKITLSTGQIIVTQHAEGNANFGRGGEWTTVWIDEIGTFPRIADAWTNALPFSMRVALPGTERSRVLLTTTPKAETAEAFHILKDLVAEGATGKGRVVVTVGTTWENLANIPAEDLEEWEELFPPGSRTRRQELDAELLDNVEGSLWTADLIGDHRVDAVPDTITARVVSVDPAYTAGPHSDLTGIILVAKAMVERSAVGTIKARHVPHFYIEKDASLRAPVGEWARVAVRLAVDNDATLLVEVDNGADMNKKTLQEAARELGVTCPTVHEVRARNEGSKAARATPVVGRYEAGCVHHVGYLPELEGQQTTWVPDLTKKSPDRIDALVHGVRHLLGAQRTSAPARTLW